MVEVRTQALAGRCGWCYVALIPAALLHAQFVHVDLWGFLDAGQAEQWNRIARVKLHQYQQLNKAQDASSTEVQPSAVTDAEPHAQHLNMMVKQAFESIISSEELPRPRSHTGSLEEHHLRGTEPEDSDIIKPAIDKVSRKLLRCTVCMNVIT